jgi:hypothetical protein
MSIAKPAMKASNSSSTTLVLQGKAAKSQEIGLWSNNFMSNWFFLWTFPIIGMSRSKDASPDSLSFKLRQGETARVNADALTKAWNDELQGHKE